jgi:hypothetical protein
MPVTGSVHTMRVSIGACQPQTRIAVLLEQIYLAVSEIHLLYVSLSLEGLDWAHLPSSLQHAGFLGG